MTSRRRLPHIFFEDTWLFLTWCLHRSLPPSHFPPARKVTDGEAFAWIDRYLDVARMGPTFLKQEAIAAISPRLLQKALKGASAREANRLLQRTGEQFWQRETYDHLVRSEAEWNRIARYIENNPVR